MTTTPTPGTDAAGPAVAEVADAALHGSYCPKMCSHACPVAAATGDEHAVPWTFHRTVSDLATGRLPLVDAGDLGGDVVADRLSRCTGCLACRQPCSFDQDVPAQVRAGRAALVETGHAAPPVAAAVAAVAAGRTPHGAEPLTAPPADDDPTVVLVAGCRDDADALDATVSVLRAAGERVEVRVPDGCCGALLDDLGARDAAAEARTRLTAAVGDARLDAVAATAGHDPANGDGDGHDADVAVVATDPHCLPALRAAGVRASDLASYLDAAVTDGRLRFPGGAPWTTTWHDPCVLARVEDVTAAPRRVLQAAGAALDEPEHTARATACSGAGMGMDLLAPAAADATARARAADLGDGAVVTGCARARDRLRGAGVDATDLASALAVRLGGYLDPTTRPAGPTSGSHP